MSRSPKCWPSPVHVSTDPIRGAGPGPSRTGAPHTRPIAPLTALAQTATALIATALIACAMGLPRTTSPLAAQAPSTEVHPTPPPIRLAYFGPTDPNHPAAAMFLAAQLALEDATHHMAMADETPAPVRGRTAMPDEAPAPASVRGPAADPIDTPPAATTRPTAIQLAPVWSPNPWSTGVRDLAALAFDPATLAIIGAPDGPTTHLAEQIAAKARLPVLGCGGTDDSVNLAGVSWMFSCLPGDDRLAAALADHIARAVGPTQRLTVISATDHDAHWFASRLLAVLHRIPVTVAAHLELDAATDVETLRNPTGPQPPPSIDGISPLVVVADTETSARWVRQLRRAGHTGPLFTGPTAATARFIHLAGPAAENVQMPLPYIPGPDYDRLLIRIKTRGAPWPDYRAAQTYDAVRLLVTAWNTTPAPPHRNRGNLADVLHALKPYPGVAGPIAWDHRGRNQRPIPIARVHCGRIVPLKTSRASDPPPPHHGDVASAARNR